MVLGRFLRWWLSELHGLLPRSKGPTLSRKRMFNLSQDGTDLVIRRHAQPTGQVITRVPRATIPDSQHPVVTHDMFADGKPIGLVIAKDMVLTKQVQLPLAAEENLSEVLGFEMERQTPFQASDVVFAHRIMGRNPGQGTLRVELMVARRRMLSGVLTSMGISLGISHDVDVSIVGGDMFVELLPAGSSTSTRGPTTAVLVGLNMVLLAVFCAIPYQRQMEQLQSLQVQLNDVRQAAIAINVLQTQQQTLMDQLQVLDDAVGKQPPVVLLLEELSARLPDDSWLQRLDVKDRQIHFQGVSKQASRLIALVDDSPYFKHPAFQSPVTQDASTGLERFQMSVEIVTGTEDGG